MASRSGVVTRSSFRKEGRTEKASESETSEEVSLEVDEEQVKRAQEIIERLQRKYMHKIEENNEVKNGDLLLENEVEDNPSPLKKREEEGVRESKPTEGVDKENERHAMEAKQDQIKRIKRRGRGRERNNDKHTSQNVSTSPKPRLPLVPPLATPNNQSTPCCSETKENRRTSFGFNKLNCSLDSFRASKDVSSFDFNSQSPPPPTQDNYKPAAVKSLQFNRGIPTEAKPKDNRPKRRQTKKKPEHEDEFNKWIDEINKEFDDVDNFELTVV